MYSTPASVHEIDLAAFASMEIHNVVCKHLHVHDGMEGGNDPGSVGMVWDQDYKQTITTRKCIGKLQYG